MAVLPGVLGFRPLRCTVLVRLGTNTLWLPGGPATSPERAGSQWRAGTAIFAVSRQKFMKYPDREWRDWRGVVLKEWNLIQLVTVLIEKLS